MVFVRVPSSLKDGVTHQHGDKTITVPWGSTCVASDCDMSNPPKTHSYPDGFRTMELPLERVRDLLDRHPDKGIEILLEEDVLAAVAKAHPDAIKALPSRKKARKKPRRKPTRKPKKGGK